MPSSKRRDPAEVDAAVTSVLAAAVAGAAPPRTDLALAVRGLADRLAALAPGRHVEVRIPPYAAVQCVAGPRHTRGRPPNVVEADPITFVELCVGRLAWTDAVRDGRVRTWGDRADLSSWLPLPQER
ncbi:MAG: hypothetical protein KY440_10535 [Actinobacteria bacterium]|nr:hypothetical protein [Actinomycetota bacterium]